MEFFYANLAKSISTCVTISNDCF